MNSIVTTDGEGLTYLDLQNAGEPLEIIDLAVNSGFDGELYFVGAQFRAKVCVFERRLAWVYCSAHQEHLGSVLEREEGIPGAILARAMHEAKRNKRLFGEWLVEQGLVTMDRLSWCLRKHLAAHMRHLGLTAGEFEVALVEQHYRYDHALTFSPHDVFAEAVFEVAREPFRFAEALTVVNPFDQEVIAIERDCDQRLIEALCDLAGRIERFSSDVALYQGPAVFRADGVVYAVLPLRTHPRMSLGVAIKDDTKVGLVLQRAAGIAETI